MPTGPPEGGPSESAVSSQQPPPQIRAVGREPLVSVYLDVQPALLERFELLRGQRDRAGDRAARGLGDRQIAHGLAARALGDPLVQPRHGGRAAESFEGAGERERPARQRGRDRALAAHAVRAGGRHPREACRDLVAPLGDRHSPASEPSHRQQDGYPPRRTSPPVPPDRREDTRQEGVKAPDLPPSGFTLPAMTSKSRALALVLFGAGPASAQTPTFSKDVAPIVFTKCASCHRPGEVAPMSLTSFKEV